MKNDRDNQKNRDEQNKRNIRKLNIDEPDDYSGDNEDFVPGIDDIDHFDFTDEDIEHFRHQDENGTDEKASSSKKKNTFSFTNTFIRHRDNVDNGMTESEEEAYEREQRKIRAQKRRTNKEIMRVTNIMLVLFFGMIAYFIYFDAVESKNVIYDSHNSRLATMAEQTVRGDIVSADGEILAQTLTDSDGQYYRYYPYGNVFAHVVGTSDVNKSGIESYADYSLISSDIPQLERIINEITGQKSPGNTVVTTLNAGLQKAAYDALGDNQGAVVVLEPSTGKILAMVSKPDYDPNTLADSYDRILNDSGSKVLLNQATQGLFVPGSIFKIVTTLAYLRSGADPYSYVYSCSGSISLDDGNSLTKLACYSGTVHGSLNLTQSFAKSCNSSFANIGLSVSTDVMNKTANDLLFNQTLPSSVGSAVSRFDLSSSDSDWVKGATAIGQGSTVMTPLHAAMIVSAIANGGTLMEPYLIDEVVSAEGSQVDKYSPESYGSLMSASEAAILTDMMKAVTEYGTGSSLSSKSYNVAGKTGTAEVTGSGNNAWYVGFAPYDNPEIAVCVVIEDTAGTGSSAALPAASKILDTWFQ